MNCYNGSKYLNFAVNSIISQTYKKWEIIFWDNASTDDSLELIKKFTDSRIKIYQSKNHTNLSTARNNAINKSNGEFISFLDVDDEWLPNKLERYFDIYKNMNINIIHSNYFIYHSIKKKKWVKNKFIVPSGMITHQLLNSYNVGLLTLSFRKKITINNNKNIFNPKFHLIGDLDLVIRLSIKNFIYYEKIPTAIYRIHQHNETSSKNKLMVHELEYFKNSFILKKFNNQKKIIRNFNSNINYIKGKDYLLNGNKNSLKKCLKKMHFGSLKIKLIIGKLIPFKFLSKFIS